MNFICPVCSEPLVDNGASLICNKNHCFDKAKSGYVNLLTTGGKKGHGDDKLMVQARKSFLDAGYYKPLLEELENVFAKLAQKGNTVLDSGCGEGWYTENIYNSLVNQNINVEMLAIDISKDALTYAAKRCKAVSFAVASAYKLPVADNSCDIVLSLFAPFAESEFKRVLHDEGLFITAVPLRRHLFALKSAVYELPYENEVEDFNIDGFELEHYSEVKKTITLKSNSDIKNLFMMTPYYYKTSVDDQKKLDGLTELQTEIEFAVAAYRKRTGNADKQTL